MSKCIMCMSIVHGNMTFYQFFLIQYTVASVGHITYEYVIYEYINFVYIQ